MRRGRNLGGGAVTCSVRMSRLTALSLEPLRFERMFLEKVWGGRNLERVPGNELPGGLVGETWELTL